MFIFFYWEEQFRYKSNTNITPDKVPEFKDDCLRGYESLNIMKKSLLLLPSTQAQPDNFPYIC